MAQGLRHQISYNHISPFKWHMAQGLRHQISFNHISPFKWHMAQGLSHQITYNHISPLKWHMAQGLLHQISCNHISPFKWHMAQGLSHQITYNHISPLKWHMAQGLRHQITYNHISPFKWHILITFTFTTTISLTYKIPRKFTWNRSSLSLRVWSSYRRIFGLLSSHFEFWNDVGHFLTDSFQYSGAGPQKSTYLPSSCPTLAYLTGKGKSTSYFDVQVSVHRYNSYNKTN